MSKSIMRPCGKCGHAKSIHIRLYGRMYVGTKLLQSCNFPGCKYNGDTPAGTQQGREANP